MRHGNLFVVSGPSGTGKGTLIARLLEEVPDAWLSVSATTRRPRPGEEEGVSYYFLTKEEFLSLAEEGGFLEWAEYSGNCYGTPRASVEREDGGGTAGHSRDRGSRSAPGAPRRCPRRTLVFIEPPSLEELERRLRGRGTETDDVVDMRMRTALVELSQKMEYDYRLVNDDLDEATRQLVAYVNEIAEQQ